MVAALLIYQIQNYKIKLEYSKQIMLRLIYSLFKNKVWNIQKYQKKNFKKRFIKKFKSLVEYLIFFIMRKNRTLYLYTNYSKLNNVIINNQYLLSIMS